MNRPPLSARCTRAAFPRNSPFPNTSNNRIEIVRGGSDQSFHAGFLREPGSPARVGFRVISRISSWRPSCSLREAMLAGYLSGRRHHGQGSQTKGSRMHTKSVIVVVLASVSMVLHAAGVLASTAVVG